MRPLLCIAWTLVLWTGLIGRSNEGFPRAAAQTPRNETPAPLISSGRLPTADRESLRRDADTIRLADPAWTAESPARSFRDANAQPAPSRIPNGTHPVVPAQFTSSEPALPGLNRSPAGPGEKSSGVRPLKPPSSGEPEKEKRSNGTIQLFVSVASSLLIVLGLVLGAAWCYRRAVPGAVTGMPKQVLQVLGRMPLAPRQQLVLIRFGHKLVLVSNLHGEVRTISEITDPLEVDRVAGICESSQAGSISDSFRSVLHNLGRNG